MKPFYQHAGITIYHGDCREIMPQLPKGWCSTCACELADEMILAIHLAGKHAVGPMVDVVVTDPPYGILNLEGVGSTPCVRKSPRQMGSGKLKDRILNRTDVDWDIAPTVEDFKFLREISSTQIIWGGNYFPLPPARGILVWDKQQPWENFSQVELAWTNLQRPAAIFRESCTQGTPNKEHPTQKPLSLMKWCVAMTEGAVLDPYMGVGTTLVAAKDSARRAIGIEIEEKYCESAAKRLSQEVLSFV